MRRILTTNEGLGTLYDRVWKSRILKQIIAKYDVSSLTELDVGVTLFDCGGVGMDTLLIHDQVKRISLVYQLQENLRYAEKFYGANRIVFEPCSMEAYLDGYGGKTDLAFGNYIFEFGDPAEKIVEAMRKHSRYLLFFESNYRNIGHRLVKTVGSKYWAAPWVDESRVKMETYPNRVLQRLKDMGVRILDFGYMDLPFFAIPSGMSPFKNARQQRATFTLVEMKPRTKLMIEVGFALEKLYPMFFKTNQSHMYYVLCEA